MTLLIKQPIYHYTLIDTILSMLCYSWHNKLLYLYTSIDTATFSYDTWYNNQYIITHQMIQQSVCYDTWYSNLPYYIHQLIQQLLRYDATDTTT